MRLEVQKYLYDIQQAAKLLTSFPKANPLTII